jgi:hypothetical protein
VRSRLTSSSNPIHLLDQIFHGASSSLAQDWTEAWTRGHPHITWQLPLFGTTATNSISSLRANSISMHLSNHPVWSYCHTFIHLHPGSQPFLSTFAALSCTQKARISRPLSLSTPRRESRQFQWWATDQAGHTCRFQLSTFVLVNCWQDLRARKREAKAMCWTQELKKIPLNLKMCQHWGIRKAWIIGKHVFTSKYEGFLGFRVDFIFQFWNYLKIGTPNLMDGQNLPHQNCRLIWEVNAPFSHTLDAAVVATVNAVVPWLSSWSSSLRSRLSFQSCAKENMYIYIYITNLKYWGWLVKYWGQLGLSDIY